MNKTLLLIIAVTFGIGAAIVDAILKSAGL